MTTAAQVVARQVTASGETLLLALEPLDDDEFFAELATGFSAAWSVGHLACVADLFSSWFAPRPIGGDSPELLLSREFHRVFNDTDPDAIAPVRKAASVDRGVHTKTSLLLAYRRAHVRALRILGASRDWDAPAPPGAPVTMRTAGDVWERLALHTSWHSGELAGSMPRFSGTYALNGMPHHLYVPSGAA